MLRTLALSTAAALGLAWAGEPLTQADVDSFIVVAEALNASEDDDLDLDFDLDFDDVVSLTDGMFDQDDNLALTAVLFDSLDPDSSDYYELEDVLEEAGFSSVDDFVDVSDRVIAALVASEMSASDLQELKDIADLNESQLKYVPEPVRGLVDIAPRFAEAVERVPESDVTLIEESGYFD